MWYDFRDDDWSIDWFIRGSSNSFGRLCRNDPTNLTSSQSCDQQRSLSFKSGLPCSRNFKNHEDPDFPRLRDCVMPRLSQVPAMCSVNWWCRFNEGSRNVGRAAIAEILFAELRMNSQVLRTIRDRVVVAFKIVVATRKSVLATLLSWAWWVGNCRIRTYQYSLSSSTQAVRRLYKADAHQQSLRWWSLEWSHYFCVTR